MAWTALPGDYATGHLVTASQWNTYVFDNVAYLKGQDGDVEFEDDVIPSAGTERVGISSDPWEEGHFNKLYAGPRRAIHEFVRDVTFNWEGDTIGDYQIDVDTPGGGQVENGGIGQIVFIVNDDGADGARIKGMDEQNNALDTSFNASRSPYFRAEFAVNHNVSNTGIFIGLRQTPGAALPVGAAENYAGLVWTGAIWQCQTGDASSVDGGGTETINADARYVIELLIISGTEVEFYISGTLVETLTAHVPTGDLEFAVLLESDGGGGATDTILTLGKTNIQEDLS